VAFDGAAEIDGQGNVNVSKFNGMFVGRGGFIDITQRAGKVVYAGTFTAGGGLKVSIAGGKHFPGQALQFKIADMRIQIEGARQVLHHMMELREAGMAFSEESAMSKAYATDVAINVATAAMRLMGSAGYTPVVCTLMRNAKVMQIYEGPKQIQRLVIGRAVLARPKQSAPAQTVLAK
jgi:acyl CoA:acetate/3-ketoacid CoA transferase